MNITDLRYEGLAAVAEPPNGIEGRGRWWSCLK